MRKVIFYFFGLLPLISAAQVINTRGTVVTADTVKNTGTTYALVIGISKYKEVNPLNFADKDAMVFADYLVNKNGMALDTNNVKLFVNEKATMSNIGNALSDIIIKNLKKGDKVIFFFAGHGDYDANILKDQALLLLYGAPRQNYFQNIFNGDFISTADLNSRFIEPLTNKGCEVLLFIDACHATGLNKTLSGGTEGGKITMGALQNMTSAVKIYSCKSSQYSLESEQWGGGRGLFSYVLMEALYGMADTDNDKVVTLMELQRYLEDNIPKMSEHKQFPIVKIENSDEQVTKVNLKYLTAYKDLKDKGLPFITQLPNDNNIDPVSKIDSSHNKITDNSTTKIIDSSKIKVTDNSTTKVIDNSQNKKPDSLYNKLYNECDSMINTQELEAAYRTLLLLQKTDSTSDMTLQLRRKLSDAYQQKTATLLNPLLRNIGNLEANNNQVIKFEKDLEIAAKLLGENHILYHVLNARRLFLKAQLLETKNGAANDEAIDYLEQSIVLEPNAPYAYFTLGNRYYSKNEFDKAKMNFDKYIGLIPNSAWAYNNRGLVYYNQKNYDSAIFNFKKAIVIKPDYAVAYNNAANAYSRSKFYDEAIIFYKKAMEIDPTNPMAYNGLGDSYSNLKSYDSAILYFKKALELNPAKPSPGTYFNLGRVYSRKKEYAEARKNYKKVLDITPDNVAVYMRLGDDYANLRNFDSAIINYKKIIELEPNNKDAEYYLCQMYSLKKDTAKSLSYLEQVLKKNYQTLNYMENDTEIDNIRTLYSFKLMLEKYFKKEELARYPNLYSLIR